MLLQQKQQRTARPSLEESRRINWVWNQPYLPQKDGENPIAANKKKKEHTPLQKMVLILSIPIEYESTSVVDLGWLFINLDDLHCKVFLPHYLSTMYYMGSLIYEKESACPTPLSRGARHWPLEREQWDSFTLFGGSPLVTMFANRHISMSANQSEKSEPFI